MQSAPRNAIYLAGSLFWPRYKLPSDISILHEGMRQWSLF